jgi:hypothetical protein
MQAESGRPGPAADGPAEKDADAVKELLQLGFGGGVVFSEVDDADI